MKAIMVALLACMLVSTLALAQEGQAPDALNTITGVHVTGGRVEIVGTKKPNFTTFTMTDPPRLVIDISEAVFSGVKEELTVGNGIIIAIRTASYGSDESAIARVLIGYEREVETDIQATGNALVVSMAGGGGAAVAQRPAATPGTAPAGTAPAETPAPGVTAAEAAEAARVERQRQEQAAAEAAEAARADEEAQRQAQARAEAERKAQQEAARESAQQAQQAEQRRLQEERAAKEAAAAAEKQRQREEARAAAEQKQRQQADERARREAEAQAAAEARKRQREEARAAAAEERQARLAQVGPPRRAPSQGDGAGASTHGKTMTLVGFKQEPTRSRVFVLTDEPVRYTITEGDDEVVLELENTRIAETNNARSLNTSFFDTPVASVDADAGPSRTVRVSIKLKERAAYQTRQEGNEVSIEFQRSSR